MIFVSYSWIDNNPDEEVLSLVERLRNNGYDATCDVMCVQQRTSAHFPELMASRMRDAEKVIVVLSEQYKAKADSFKCGVGTEYRYIITDIEKNSSKYILVCFRGEYTEVVPDFLNGREIIYLNSEDKYKKLYHRICGSEEYVFSDVNPHRTIPESKKMSEIVLVESSHIPGQFENDYKIALANVRNAKKERELGNIRKALDFYAQAERKYREINDNLRLADVLMSMNILENVLENNCQKANDYLTEVRRIFTETGERRDYLILTKMGSISSRWSMYDDARTYFRRAEDGCKKNNDKPSLANVYRLRGILEGKPRLRNINEAKKYLTKADSIYFSLDDLDGQARICQALGDIEREYKDYISAAKSYEKAYDIYLETHNLSQQSILLGELYRVCAYLGDECGTQKWEKKIKTLYDNIPLDSRVYVDNCLEETLRVAENGR